VDYAPTVDPQPPPEGRFETFDANERFVVVRDEDGYSVAGFPVTSALLSIYLVSWMEEQRRR
jgi:hypothetical protein